MSGTTSELKHLGLFIPSFAGGGAERVMLNLAGAFSARGYRVDLIVCRAKGEWCDQIPEGVKVVELRRASSKLLSRFRVLMADPTGFASLSRPALFPFETSSTVRYLPDLVCYLRCYQPEVLLSALTYPNLLALWARRLAGLPSRVVVSQHSPLSRVVQADSARAKWPWRFLPSLVARNYAWADAIIAVSSGVADDLSALVKMPRERIVTIYNPVVTAALEQKSSAPCEHPWFVPGGPPVVLAAGRLAEPKDYATVLRAFARVRRVRAARLVILGEGRERPKLEALAQQLVVAGDVALPGFVSNPFAYMARAAVFVLSSAYEGLPSVLIEALACGCPVVSTNCPGGAAEILEGGRYGALVPVGDDAALAEAITDTLDVPRDRNRLRERAALFSADGKAEQYLRVLLE